MFIRTSRTTKLAVAALSISVLSAVLYAVAPGDRLSVEGRANTTTTNAQTAAAVARDADGDYVVVYASAQTDAGDIYFQRYNAKGVAQGSETKVNTGSLVQGNPSVAMDGSGNFVVT